MPSLSSLKITPLHPTFAAEVEGIDFSEPVSDAIFNELKDIISRYAVVIMRNTNLKDDKTHVEFSRRFGPLDKSAHRVPGFRNLPYIEIFDVANLDDKDQIVLPGNLSRVASANGNALWHSDGSFNPRRTGISMLRAVELPPSGTGGHTEYLDVRTAYNDLSDEMKAKIKDKVGLHSIFHNRKTANPDSPLFKDINVLDHPMAKHKLAQVHESSQRPTLYVTSYTHHIEGMPIEEGQAIIKELMIHLDQEKYKFTHYWSDPGDIAFWDNTATLHRATHGNYEGKHRRDLRRTSIFDTSSEAYGMNDPKLALKQGPSV